MRLEGWLLPVKLIWRHSAFSQQRVLIDHQLDFDWKVHERPGFCQRTTGRRHVCVGPGLGVGSNVMRVGRSHDLQLVAMVGAGLLMVTRSYG